MDRFHQSTPYEFYLHDLLNRSIAEGKHRIWNCVGAHLRCVSVKMIYFDYEVMFQLSEDMFGIIPILSIEIRMSHIDILSEHEGNSILLTYKSLRERGCEFGFGSCVNPRYDTIGKRLDQFLVLAKERRGHSFHPLDREANIECIELLRENQAEFHGL